MATIDECNERVKILLLTKSEAVTVIGLLAAQLADTALPGHCSGGTPNVRVTENGEKRYELEILVR